MHGPIDDRLATGERREPFMGSERSVNAFGLAPLPRSLGAALRDVRDPKAAVRRSSVEDLVRHATGQGKEQAVQALVGALRSDVSADVRGAAALALADAHVAGCSEALVAAVKDSHLHVRQMAMIALGELGSPDDVEVMEVVERLLQDEAAALRFQALIASSRLFGPRAERALLRGLTDVDPEVRHVALRLLEELGAVDGGMVKAAPEVLTAARRALRDSDGRVRAAAAILIGRGGDTSSASALAEVVADTSGTVDPDDEQTAIALVGELGIREAIPGLERRAYGRFGIGGGRYAYDARISLALLGDARARAGILRGLNGWTRDSRTLSVVAAGKARLVEARAIIEEMRGRDGRADPGAVTEALAALDRASRSPANGPRRGIERRPA